MVTLVDFVAQLVGSLFDLVVIFLLEVALSDPLSFVSFLVGAGLTTFAIVVFGYLALGGIADALFGDFGSRSGDDTIGRTPPPRE